MPEFDPSALTIAERQKVEKSAKRNLHSENALILSAGFATILVSLFWLAQYSFLPIAEAIGMRPSAVWIGMSVGITLMGAALHARRASRTIASARKKQFEIHRFDEAKKRAETAAKLDTFKNRTET